MDFVDTATAAQIHDEFAIPVAFTSQVLGVIPTTAIKMDVPADEFAGPGATKRRVSFELMQADVPDRPAKGDMVKELPDGPAWRVNQSTRRSDVGAWWVDVESVPAP